MNADAAAGQRPFSALYVTRFDEVNAYMDAGEASANRAKLDLDRDDKWTFEAAGVQRQVALADDEDYTEVLRWSGTEWVPEG